MKLTDIQARILIMIAAAYNKIWLDPTTEYAVLLPTGAKLVWDYNKREHWIYGYHYANEDISKMMSQIEDFAEQFPGMEGVHS